MGRKPVGGGPAVRIIVIRDLAVDVADAVAFARCGIIEMLETEGRLQVNDVAVVRDAIVEGWPHNDQRNVTRWIRVAYSALRRCQTTQGNHCGQYHNDK